MRKTGLAVFSARIASIFTGLVFLVLMTRTLSASQFGLWEVIIDLVTFASYPAGLVTFWATREVARGSWVGRTAITMSMIMSALGIVLYLVFSYFTYPAVKASAQPLLLAIMLVPASYWNMAANSVATGHRPSALGYSVVASEVSKIAVAIPLLLVLRTGIDGVIVSMFVAYLAQAAVSSYMVRDASSESVSLSTGRRWLWHSWLPAIITLPYALGIADTFVASVAANGTSITGYYQAAYSVASIAGYSIYLASALYPLLLRGGSDDLPSVTLDLALLFGIPMAFGAAALSRPILFFLRPQYAAVSSSLGVLAFSAIFVAASGILDQTLMGREKVDAEENAGLRRYLRSDLVFVALVDILYAAVYVASIYVTIRLGVAAGLAVSQVVGDWAVVQLLVTALFVLVKVRRARSRARVRLFGSFAWYLAGGGIMSAVAYGLSGMIVYTSRTLLFGVQLAGVGLTSLAVYGLFLYAVDRKFRELLLSLVRASGLVGR